MTLEKGEIVALVGSSGAGKSTLLQILGTLDDPDSGTVHFEARDVGQLPPKQKAKFRNLKLGFIFQFHHLLPSSTLLKMCACQDGLLVKTRKK